MNNDSSKLRLTQEHAQETVPRHHAEQKQRGREFASVEEIIRTDREQVEVPATLRERLNDSILKEPTPKKPWWKKIFGRA
jgi:hypothetical protein